MQGVADSGHILRHTRKDIADGRMIDKADRQTLKFVGYQDAQNQCKITADGAVEKLHLSVADSAPQDIPTRQRQKPRRQLRQNRRACLRRVKIVN